MEKLNKYGFLHGGYSFYTLDTRAHVLALETIGEAMTSHASIYYHKPISLDDLSVIAYDVSVISTTKSSVNIQGKIFKGQEAYITCFFTFVKIK